MIQRLSEEQQNSVRLREDPPLHLSMFSGEGAALQKPLPGFNSQRRLHPSCVGRIAAIAAGRNPATQTHRRFESYPAHHIWYKEKPPTGASSAFPGIIARR